MSDTPMSDATSPADSAPHPSESSGTDASAAGMAPEPVQQELDSLRDKHLRLAAEFDNFRRRAVKERQEAGWRAQGELVRGLLDALDDVARFARVDPATVDTTTVVEGVALVERKLLKSLAGHGFELLDPTGHAFDPALHEAVSTVPAEQAELDGTVAVCFQSGYMINGLVLRPARVVVKQWHGA